MKKLFTLSVFCCLFAVAAFAQDAKKTDFSGTWTLDIAKSQLGERSRVEAMTLSVAQAPNELKVTTETKRQAPPEGAGGGSGMGRGMGRGGFGGGDGTTTYMLDKETTVEVEGPNGKMPLKLKAAVEPGGKATLTQTRTLTMPSGEITINVKESWSLSPDGKTLTVVREQSTPRGPNTTTMVFVKKA